MHALIQPEPLHLEVTTAEPPRRKRVFVSNNRRRELRTRHMRNTCVAAYHAFEGTDATLLDALVSMVGTYSDLSELYELALTEFDRPERERDPLALGRSVGSLLDRPLREIFDATFYEGALDDMPGEWRNAFQAFLGLVLPDVYEDDLQKVAERREAAAAEAERLRLAVAADEKAMERVALSDKEAQHFRSMLKAFGKGLNLAYLIPLVVQWERQVEPNRDALVAREDIQELPDYLKRLDDSRGEEGSPHYNPNFARYVSSIIRSVRLYKLGLATKYGTFKRELGMYREVTPNQMVNFYIYPTTYIDRITREEVCEGEEFIGFDALDA